LSIATFEKATEGRRMKPTIVTAAAIVLSSFAMGVHAQASGVRLQMDSGFYVGAAVLRSETRDFCDLGGACDAKDVGGSLFAGYKFNRNFALEAGYSDFGQAKTSGFIGGVAGSAKSETQAFELLAVGFLPLTERFAFYAKGGVYRYESDGSATGAVIADSNDKGTELTFGVGAEYTFVRAFVGRVEWQRYFEAGSGIFGLPKSDITVLRLGGRYQF
jgi:OOP family OmpA-OmpF porin